MDDNLPRGHPLSWGCFIFSTTFGMSLGSAMGLRVRWIKIDDAHIAEVGDTPQ
jgi:hypothetical protein